MVHIPSPIRPGPAPFPALDLRAPLQELGLIDSRGFWLEEEGRLLMGHGAVLVQGGSLPIGEIELTGSLLEYLLAMEPSMAEVCGWALVNAARMEPLISWRTRKPLLTIASNHPEAFLSTGQRYRAEVLHKVLALAGILHHSLQSEWELAPREDMGVLAEASEGLSWVWNALLWRTGVTDVRRPNGAYDSSGGGHLIGLMRLTKVDPVAAEAAGWLLCRGAYQALVVDCVGRTVEGKDGHPDETRIYMQAQRVLTLAGVLRHKTLFAFERATNCIVVNETFHW